VNRASADTFYPANEAVKLWCNEKDLTAPFTLEQWFQAVLTDVLSSDLETRTMKFGEKCIWGSNKMTVFEILQVVPTHLKHVTMVHAHSV
jgi:hypothetical protein